MFELLLQALQATGIPTAEGDWDRAPQSGSYLTIALSGETSSVWADGHQRQQALGLAAEKEHLRIDLLIGFG